MRKLFKPNFEIVNIDESNADYDIITTEGAKPNDLQTKKLEDNALMFKVPKGLDLFNVEDPLFNLSRYLKKYANNSIKEINNEIEQNSTIKGIELEFVNGEYYIPIFTFFALKKQFSAEGQRKRSGLNYIREVVSTIRLDGNGGSAMFSAGKVMFEADGSGQVASGNIMWGVDGSGTIAGGNIIWDAQGNIITRGQFESNFDGNRIVINPYDRSLKMYNKIGQEMLQMQFSDNNGYSPIFKMWKRDANGKAIGRSIIQNDTVRVDDLDVLNPKFVEIKPDSIRLFDGTKQKVITAKD